MWWMTFSWYNSSQHQSERDERWMWWFLLPIILIPHLHQQRNHREVRRVPTREERLWTRVVLMIRPVEVKKKRTRREVKPRRWKVIIKNWTFQQINNYWWPIFRNNSSQEEVQLHPRSPWPLLPCSKDNNSIHCSRPSTHTSQTNSLDDSEAGTGTIIIVAQSIGTPSRHLRKWVSVPSVLQLDWVKQEKIRPLLLLFPVHLKGDMNDEKAMQFSPSIRCSIKVFLDDREGRLLMNNILVLAIPSRFVAIPNFPLCQV